MIQKLLIEVDAPMPLQSYGEGHVIMYNAQRGRYYVTSRENLLAVQNAKISELEKTILDTEERVKETQTEISKTVGDLIQSFADFQIKSREEQAKFYETYKETNAKILDLVKKSCVSGE